MTEAKEPTAPNASPPAAVPPEPTPVAEPAVSVVIPVLNGARTIRSVLVSLANQAGAPAHETLVVDNGSTDDTVQIVGDFPEVTLLHEVRRGPAAARNHGLRAARGEIVAFLDADAQPVRRWLAELVQPFSDPATLLTCGPVHSAPPRTAAQRFFQRAGMHAFHEDTIQGPPSANVAIRREAALELGGFDESLQTAEDLDLWIRFRARFAAPLVVQARAVVLHENRDTDEALERQASGYGYGAAQLYRRYPDLLPWGWPQRRAVASRLSRQMAGEVTTRVAGRLGRAAAPDVEYAIYYRRWALAYWQGFFRGRRGGRP